MQQQAPFYPIRIVSRSVARRRTRRISYSLLGLAFGAGCFSALSPIVIAPSAWIYADRAAEKPALAAAVDFDAPTLTAAEAPQDSIGEQLEFDLASVETEAETAQTVTFDTPTPASAYPVALDLKVEDGDTLISILKDTGVSYEEAQNAVDSLRKVFNPKRLDIGQSVTVSLNKAADGELPYITSLKLPVSATATVEAKRRTDDDFDVKKIDAPVERKLARAGGRINSSLYETGSSSGLPATMLNQIITAYSYDVDFQREIQPGNAIDVLYEKYQTKEGVGTGVGAMLFAELKLKNRTLKIYRYVDKSGNADYYTEKGESIRKALLRTPINGARITSGFGMRSHPLLGYTKMHRGVDFGAPTGTPIYAAGDGTIAFAGRKGGYGNYLAIKHNDKYSSAYGHISRFASGMAPGKKVKQGQIVAYVGSTGMSTGPHLHYEILVSGQQVNPAGVKFKTGNSLGGKELAAFKKNVQDIQTALNNTARKTDVAMNDTPKGKSSN